MILKTMTIITLSFVLSLAEWTRGLRRAETEDMTKNLCIGLSFRRQATKPYDIVGHYFKKFMNIKIDWKEAKRMGDNADTQKPSKCYGYKIEVPVSKDYDALRQISNEDIIRESSNTPTVIDLDWGAMKDYVNTMLSNERRSNRGRDWMEYDLGIRRAKLLSKKTGARDLKIMKWWLRHRPIKKHNAGK